MTGSLNWDDIETFLAVAQTGRARAAAARLRVSQPTIGRRIERLESALRLHLFDRSHDGYVLTRQGERLLPQAQAMAAAAAGFTPIAAEEAPSAPVDVRVSASDWPATFLATQADALCALEAAAGARVEIDVSEDTAALSLRQADIAIRHGLPQSGDFVTRRLGGLPCAIYGSRAYVAAHPSARDDRRFTDCDWIMHTHEQAHYVTMRWLADRLKGRSARLRAATTAVLHQAVAAGGGLAILPCFLGDSDPRCEPVSDTIADVHGDYWLVAHKQLLRRPPIRRTVDTLAKMFAA